MSTEVVPQRGMIPDDMKGASDRQILIAVLVEIRELKAYVSELDNKARAFGDPANMEKIMSGMLGNMMGM